MSSRDWKLGKIAGLWGYTPLDEYDTPASRPITWQCVKGAKDVLDAVLAVDPDPLIYAEWLDGDESCITFETAYPLDQVHVGADGVAFVWGEGERGNDRIPFPPGSVVVRP